MPREAKHTNFSSAHNTHSTEGRPRGSREVWHTNLSSAHKLQGTEGRPREPKEEHTSPLTYRAGWGAKTSAHKPRDTESGPREPSTQNPHYTEGELMGLRETPQVSVIHRTWSGSREKMHRNPYLASLCVQCKVGPGNRSTSKDSRDK